MAFRRTFLSVAIALLSASALARGDSSIVEYVADAKYANFPYGQTMPSRRYEPTRPDQAHWIASSGSGSDRSYSNRIRSEPMRPNALEKDDRIATYSPNKDLYATQQDRMRYDRHVRSKEMRFDIIHLFAPSRRGQLGGRKRVEMIRIQVSMAMRSGRSTDTIA